MRAFIGKAHLAGGATLPVEILKKYAFSGAGRRIFEVLRRF
jgi:hypothetical protein